MRINGNDLIVYRGETFTIDRSVFNRDDSPFVISNQLENPYILVNVSSATYTQSNRYVRNWWLDLSDLRRFYSTNAIELDNFDAGLPEEYEPDEALFFVTNDDGTKTYKMWNEDAQQFEDYVFRIVKSFTHEDTREWVEQDYSYSISLVTGASTENYLYTLCENYLGVVPNSLEEAYELISNYNKTLIEGIDITRPIVKIAYMQPILPPSKLSVMSSNSEVYYE